MKNLILLILIIGNQIMLLSGQTSFTGKYHDYFGSRLEIKSDGTFYYDYRFDLMYGWKSGTWINSLDTIKLIPVTIFDTLVLLTEQETVVWDSLVVSLDTISNHITLGQYLQTKDWVGGQIEWETPGRFVFNRNKLYLTFANGRLQKNRIQGFGTKKKFPTYFIKE